MAYLSLGSELTGRSSRLPYWRDRLRIASALSREHSTNQLHKHHTAPLFRISIYPPKQIFEWLSQWRHWCWCHPVR